MNLASLKRWIRRIYGYFTSRWPYPLPVKPSVSPNLAEDKFFNSVFRMLSALTTADGRVSAEEIAAIDSFMLEDLKASDEQRAKAIEIFRKAKEEQISFETECNEFYELFPLEPEIRELMLDLLLRVAHADRSRCFNEAPFIRIAKECLRIDKLSFARVSSRYLLDDHFERMKSTQKNTHYEQVIAPPPLSDPYAILGCSPDDSEKVVKKRYRELVKNHHPDRLRSKGLSPEFYNTAVEKFLEIQKAYEEISKLRGF